MRTYGEGLRAALGPRGVRVTVVLPGFFDSDMGARWVGPRPLAIGLDAAADRAHRAILRGARRAAFPLPLAGLLRVVDALPAGLSDWAVRRLRFRVAPEGARDGMPEGVRDGMPEGARDGMPEGARDGMPEGARDGMPEAARDGMPADPPKDTAGG